MSVTFPSVSQTRALDSPRLLAAGGELTAAQWLRGLATARATGGSAAALEYIAAGSSTHPLGAVLATPQGRAAVAGFLVGLDWGSKRENAIAVKAAFWTIAQISSDRTLSASQKATMSVDVLRSMLTAPTLPPKAADPGDQRRVESLQTSLASAKKDLAETRSLLQRNPADTDLQNIASAQQAKVSALERQLPTPVNTSPSVTPKTPATQTTRPFDAPVPTKLPPLLPPTIEGPTREQLAAQKAQAAELAAQRTQKFMAEATQLAGIGHADTVDRLKEMIETKTPEGLKAELTYIRDLLKTPGWGNIYAHNDDAPASVKKNSDFNQYNCHGWIATGADLKFLAKELDKFLKLPAQVAPAASTNTPGSVAANDTQTSAPRVDVEWADSLPGKGRRIDLWVNPDTGSVQARDPNDGRSIRLAAEIDPSQGGELIPRKGDSASQDRGRIHVFIQNIFPGASPGGPRPPPDDPKGSKAGAILGWVAGAIGSALWGAPFLQDMADQRRNSVIDTATPQAKNARLIEKMVDGNTALPVVSEIRNQIWINYLDAAMGSLKAARQGGVFSGLGRFSDEDLAGLQKQVDAFKNNDLANAQPLSASEATSPSRSLEFRPNTSSDNNKKTETATLFFQLVNQLAAADTQTLARKYFGSSDSVQAVQKFDVQGLVDTQKWSPSHPASAKALADAELGIWRHYAEQLPGLMAWPPGKAQSNAYFAGVMQWAGNPQNFEGAGGQRLDTRNVYFSPPTILKGEAQNELNGKLGPLLEQARQDINELRSKASAPVEPGAATAGSQISKLITQQQAQATAAAAPYLTRLETVQQSLKVLVPGDVLPASTALPAGTGPVTRPAAEAVIKKMQAVDARLLSADTTLTTLRTDLLFAAQKAPNGSVRDSLRGLVELVEVRLQMVKDLRQKLQTRSEALGQRVEVAPATQSPSTIRPLPLPTVPPQENLRLQLPKVNVSPNPGATGFPVPLTGSERPRSQPNSPVVEPTYQPLPQTTPMPLPAEEQTNP